jgi:hypothetical protein
MQLQPIGETLFFGIKYPIILMSVTWIAASPRPIGTPNAKNPGRG